MGSNLITGRTPAYAIVPVTVDADGHLQIDVLSGISGLEGYYSGAWRKAPIPFGASADYGLNWENLALPAAVSDQDSPALPANAFTVITAWSVKYVGVVLGVTLDIIRMDGGIAGTARNIYTFGSLVTNRWYSWNGFILCKASDILRVTVNGATLNDDLYSSVNGYYYSLNL